MNTQGAQATDEQERCALRPASRRGGRAGRFGLGLGSIFLLTFASLSAQAKPGDGFRVGQDGRLRLGVELDGRYDSQVGMGHFQGPRMGDPADGIVGARGVLSLEAPGAKHNLALRGNLAWNQYLGINENTGPLSFMSADLGGELTVNPNGQLGLDVSNTFNRSDQSQNPVFGIGTIALHNEAHARVNYRPGDGAFEVGPTYTWNADFFTPQFIDISGAQGLCTEDECNPDLARAYSSMTHTFGLDARWKFLPKSTLSFTGTVGRHVYLFTGEHEGRTLRNANATPVQALVGFGTLVNSRFSFSLRGGYMGLLFDPEADVDDVQTFVGRAEAGYKIIEGLQARIGGERGLMPVGGQANYFERTRGYVGLGGGFSRLTFTATLGLEAIDFGNWDGGRTDSNLVGFLRAEYQVNEWLRVLASAATFQRQAGVSEGATDPALAEAFTFNRHIFSVGVGSLF